MSTKNDNLFKKIDSNLEDRKHFKEAFAPALNQIGKHINDDNVIINMDLARVLLDFIDGISRHDEELDKIIETEKRRTIPALERKPDAK